MKLELEIPTKVNEIIREFKKAGFEIYIVGGAVRDILMNKIVYDWDFTTNATPEKMLKLFPNAFYDNLFGTVGIPPETDTKRPYEITTFRTEYGYSDARRPDKIKWGKKLKEDLQRRDFTINAMALQIVKTKKIKNQSQTNNYEQSSIQVEAKLIDLYEGKKDLDKKSIRAVGDPNERFSEDALRMMRAVRIASELGFTIEEKTFNAIRTNAFLINRISKERVRDELIKILASPHPYEGTLLLKNCSLMNKILPEMEMTFGIEQKSPGRHHIYDVGTHSLMSLKHVAERNTDPIVRFATLIHDIGKTQTYKKLENGTILQPRDN